MAQFTGTGSHNSNYTGTLTVVEKSYSIETNTSDIDWTLSVTTSNGWYFADYYVDSIVTINGVECLNEHAKKSLTKNGTTIIASGTLTGVQHNTDGSKTVDCSASMQTATSQSYLFGTINMSGSLALTTIPRASTMTFGTLTIGSSATFTITRASTSFTHTIKYTFDGTTANIGTGIATSKTWNVPSSFLDSLPSSTSGAITLTLETYNSGTLIGKNTYNTTVKVASSVKPSISSVTCAPVASGWLSGKSFYVSGFSKVKVTTSATAGTGSTISSYAITVDGQTGSGTPWTSAILTTAGTKTISVTVTDARGRTATKSATITVIQYTSPTITSLAVERGTYNNGWTSSPSGAHIRAIVQTTISLTDQSNTFTVTCKCGSSNPNVTVPNNTSSPATFYFTGTTTESSYTITASATDQLSTGATASKTVPTISVPFHWTKDRLGFGKVGELSKVVDSAWNIRVLKTDATASLVRAANPLATIDLQVSAAGNSGVWSPTREHWLVYDDDNGRTKLYHQYRAYNDVSSTPYTLAANTSGRLIRLLNSGAKTVTVPSGLEIGYFVDFMSAYANAKITFNFSGSEGLYVPNGGTLTSVTVPFGLTAIRLIKVSSNRWSMFNNTPTYYTAGDVLTVEDVQFGSGYITSSSTNLSFDLPLAMPILGATAATVTSMVGNCRSALGGYIQYYDGSTYTNINTTGSPQWSTLCDANSLTATVLKGHIRISMTCSNKFGRSSAAATNNSTVLCQFTSLSITLS